MFQSSFFLKYFFLKVFSLVLQALDKMTNAAAAGKKWSLFFFFFSLYTFLHSTQPSGQVWSLALPYPCAFSLPRHVFPEGLKECGACVPFSLSAYGLNWEPVQGVWLPCFMVHAGIALGDPENTS